MSGGSVLTLIGYAVGGPFGALIGGILGGLLFPPKGIKGPRLNELNIQTSTVGAPIPIVYGTYALAGNVIWSGGLIESKHEDEQGGFLGFGGQKTTSYTYSVDMAVGICEGPISGIRRIWADADLIYDSSDDETLAERWQDVFENIADAILGIRAASEQLDWELYLGTEDQLADPTIESYEGAGLVPGYRGLAYVVFHNFQLEKFGNRIPNFRFEVFSSGSEIECGIYSAGHLEPWQYMLDGGVHDPRNPDNQHLYHEGFGGLTSATQSFDVAMADMNAGLQSYEGSWVCGEIPQQGDSQYIRGWAGSTTPNQSQPCDADVPGVPSLSVDRVTLTFHLNQIRDFPLSCRENVSSDIWGCAGLWDELGARAVHAWFNAGDASGFHVLTLDNVYPTNEGVPPARWDGRGDCNPPGQPTLNKWASFDLSMICRRWHAPISNYAVTWTRVAGVFKSLRQYDDSGQFTTVLSYPLDPTLKSDHPLYNDQAFWEAAYAAAVANNGNVSLQNQIPEDWVYGVDYPTAGFSHASNMDANHMVWRAECTAVEVVCVPMAVIVSDIARRAGLLVDTSGSQVDVSDLTTCVSGYVIGRQMSARDALQPLRMYGLWDAVESGAVLKFIERGHALVESLTSADLGAHEAGSQAPSAVETSRVQEKDLPRRLRLHFANFEHDHEPSEQSASRITTEAIDELDVELPVSMPPDTAAQLAEIILYSQWVGRNTYRFSLDNSRLALEPTDCIEIPVDGQTVRVRIVAVNYSIGGVAQIEAVRDDDGSYVSTAVAMPGEPSGGVPGGPGSGPICPSGIVILDIPRLRDADVDAGYYVAIYGECESWECAELYRSSDGGVTYGRAARTNDETTVGEIDSITGPSTGGADTSGYDGDSTITVTLFEGTLESVTDAQIDAGANMAAIGQDGSWVIIQYKTAVLDTGDQWTISDIIWGVNETRHLVGTTGAGDTFVLLSDPALIRVPESADAIGVSKSFKVVTCGEAIDDVPDFDFTTWGLSYLRPCPSTVISATTTEPPVGADDGDAYLLPNDTSLSGVWALHGGEIAKWSDETDSWVYCTPVPGTIIHVIDIGGDSSTSGDGGDVIVDEDGNPTPAPWATSDATYVTVDDETAQLPNSQQLQTAILDVLAPGDNISFETDTGTGVTTISGESGLDFQDEGIAHGAVNTVNFVGAGVTSTLDSSGVLEVNIPSGGGGGGGGSMTLVGEDTLGAPGTVLTVAGLDLDIDQVYWAEWTIDNQSGSSMALSTYFNNDTTATNYDRERHGSSGSSDGAAGSNDALLVSTIATGLPISGMGWIRHNFDHKPFIHAFDQTVETTTRLHGQIVVQHRTAANVTRFDLVSSVNMATGSRLRIYAAVGDGGTGTGGGGSTIQFQDEGDDLATPETTTTVNFVGDGVTATESGGVVTVNIPGWGGSAGGGVMEYVTSFEVSGGATDTITVAGLDLDADEAYIFSMILKNATGSTLTSINCYYNGDTTTTNYDYQSTTDNGTSQTASRANTALIGSLFANADGRWETQTPLMRDFNGNPRCEWVSNREPTTTILRQSFSTRWRTSANVTSVSIVGSTASCFANGSRIDVWRRRGFTDTGDTGGGGGGGFPNATYLTEQDETADLPNSLRLVAGTNVFFTTDTGGNELEISATPGAGIPTNTQTGNYTLVLGDAGYCIYRDSGTAATWTIPANGSVAFPIGTCVMFENMDADTNITLAITTDTLRYAPGGAVGTRTLLPYARAFARKETATEWVVSGVGIN